jgi:glutathione synthase
VYSSIVLFVVQVGERNVMDQRMIEFELWERHGVPAVRLTLGEVRPLPLQILLLLPYRRPACLQVFASCRLGVDKRLIFDPSKLEGAVSTDAAEQEVSVVYFRAGYTPRDYVDDNDWAARTLIERSLAVKVRVVLCAFPRECRLSIQAFLQCPNVAYHLAGSKKVQQALAAPGVVEKFVTGADAALIRSSFAGLWSLDPDAPEKVCMPVFDIGFLLWGARQAVFAFFAIIGWCYRCRLQESSCLRVETTA